MSDAELLDKAAKAAGGHYDENTDCFSTDMINWEQWEPLEDDGDAFRLMCRLQMGVMNKRDQDPCERNKSVVVFDFDQHRLVEKHKGDELAATRRAIVRAAAAMADRKE